YTSNNRQPITFFILRFNPATRHVTMKKMPDLHVGFLPNAMYAPEPGGNQVREQQVSTFNVRGFALSPDGTRLPVLTSGWAPGRGRARGQDRGRAAGGGVAGAARQCPPGDCRGGRGVLEANRQ